MTDDELIIQLQAMGQETTNLAAQRLAMHQRREAKAVAMLEDLIYQMSVGKAALLGHPSLRLVPDGGA